jgi:hypothetical protein
MTQLEPDEIRALLEQPTVSLREACDILGFGSWAGYRAVSEGTFPVPVIRVGRAIRVPTAPLRALLEIDEPASAS